MKATLLIAAGLTTFVVAVAPAVGGKPQVSAFLTDARAGYGTRAQHGLGQHALLTDARSGYGVRADTSARDPSSGSHRFVTDARGSYTSAALAAQARALSTGFNWGDAAVGAGSTALILMLFGGGTLLILRRKGRLALRA